MKEFLKKNGVWVVVAAVVVALLLWFSGALSDVVPAGAEANNTPEGTTVTAPATITTPEPGTTTTGTTTTGTTTTGTTTTGTTTTGTTATGTTTTGTNETGTPAGVNEDDNNTPIN